MKTIVHSFILLTCFFICNGCIPGQIIKGDGNIVTHEISITDYSRISSAGSVTINYIQSDEEPYLQVTTDQNIYEMFEFNVNDKDILQIRPKKEYRRNTTFRPTEFTINTNSHEFKGAETAGSVKFNANSPLKSDNVKLSLAGSGTINLHENAEIEELKTEIAGSATLNAHKLSCKNFRGEIAGSGTLNLGGKTEKANFSIAGSGDVKAFDLRIDEMKCDIAGSGDIEAYVNNSINVSIAGSGRIKYKGDPQDIKRSVAGSGSIKKVED